jgi:hypothetical protein
MLATRHRKAHTGVSITELLATGRHQSLRRRLGSAHPAHIKKRAKSIIPSMESFAHKEMVIV